MNTHPSYTLAARPETGRTLRAWAVLRDNPVRYFKILRDLFPERRFFRLWRVRLRSPF